MVGRQLSTRKGVGSFSHSPSHPPADITRSGVVPGQTPRDYEGRRVTQMDGGF